MNCRNHASEVSEHYDAIAALWDAEQKDSSYGTESLMRAITMCGMEHKRRAHEQHPAGTWLHGDIMHWKTSERYDLILAWDSIFHVPFDKQEDVLNSICGMLKQDGILIYTIGDEIGEHVSDWHERSFYYSSLGIEKNLDILSKNECQLRHLELDQFPLKHCIIIAKKM